MARCLEPEQVMAVLHSLFSRYDDMLGPLNVYKVETIGDACECPGATHGSAAGVGTYRNVGLAGAGWVRGWRRAGREGLTPHYPVGSRS